MLENLYKKFDLQIFTSSDKAYADLIIKRLDPEGKYFMKRWYKQSCVKAPNGQFIKDLTQVGANLARTVLVDNSCMSFGQQLLNGVPVLSYNGCLSDTELMSLQDYLQHLAKVSDVRKANLDYFKLPLYADCATPDDLYERLFPAQ